MGETINRVGDTVFLLESGLLQQPVAIFTKLLEQYGKEVDFSLAQRPIGNVIHGTGVLRAEFDLTDDSVLVIETDRMQKNPLSHERITVYSTTPGKADALEAPSYGMSYLLLQQWGDGSQIYHVYKEDWETVDMATGPEAVRNFIEEGNIKAVLRPTSDEAKHR